MCKATVEVLRHSGKGQDTGPQQSPDASVITGTLTEGR